MRGGRKIADDSPVQNPLHCWRRVPRDPALKGLRLNHIMNQKRVCSFKTHFNAGAGISEALSKSKDKIM